MAWRSGQPESHLRYAGYGQAYPADSYRLARPGETGYRARASQPPGTTGGAEGPRG